MNILIASFGMLITIFGTLINLPSFGFLVSQVNQFLGTFLSPSTMQSTCFLLGGCFMLISAVREKHVFLIALQILVIVGATAAFFTLPTQAKILIPIAACFILLLFLGKSGHLKNKTDIFGAVSITILAVGFATLSPLIYCVGGITVGTYSLLSFLQGSKLALLWVFLNLVFSIVSFLSIPAHI